VLLVKLGEACSGIVDQSDVDGPLAVYHPVAHEDHPGEDDGAEHDEHQDQRKDLPARPPGASFGVYCCARLSGWAPRATETAGAGNLFRVVLSRTAARKRRTCMELNLSGWLATGGQDVRKSLGDLCTLARGTHCLTACWCWCCCCCCCYHCYCFFLGT